MFLMRPNMYRMHAPKFGQSRLAGVRNIISKKPMIVSMMGGPGSGKGTQCARLEAFLNDNTKSDPFKARLPRKVFHVDVGQMLRTLAENEPDRIVFEDATIADILSAGIILPSSVTVPLVIAEVERIEAQIKSEDDERDISPIDSPYPPCILLDGFPRTVENLEAFERVRGPLSGMILLELAPDAMLGRLRQRALQSGTARPDDEAAQDRIRVHSSLVQSLVDKFTLVDIVQMENNPAPVYDAQTLRVQPLMIGVEAEAAPGKVEEEVRNALAVLTNQWY